MLFRHARADAVPALDAALAPPQDAAPGDGPPTETPGEPTADGASAALVDERIPTVVSAAWELELLIAGAVTFALFQLPGSLDTLRMSLAPKVTGGLETALVFGYLYSKVMIYVLLAAFVLNLTARAYWVGLVGLHSVYPRGVRWEQMRMGPASIETYRARLVSLPAIIARVDNFASIIFSFAFLIVVVCLFSLLGAAIAGSIAAGLNALLFGGRHGVAVFEAIVFAVTIPLAAASLVDKKYGARWAPDSVAGRRLRRILVVTAGVNGTTVFGPIFFTLFTNIRRGWMISIFYLAFLGGLVAAGGEFLYRLGAFARGTPRYVPDAADIRGVDADFYESMRGPGSSASVPTIQADVIEGPYVRLFVPYVSERHDPAIARRCPGARPLRASRLHLALAPRDRAAANQLADTALACIAAMHAVTMDGAPQPGVRLRYYTHPTSGVPGLLAYLPTATLASGMHTLGVTPPPRAPTATSTRPLVPYEIVFWK